ncbi:MAG: DNA-formamidopyrimidine glycosylase family protein [Planctomycetota bacterium]
MPEGHIIRIEADKQDAMLGRRMVKVSSPQGRFEEADVIDGHKLQRVEGRGKVLFYHFTHDDIVMVHLGRLGKFRHHRKTIPEPRGAVRMRLESTDAALDLIAPITCKIIGSDEHRAELDKLGPDPLAPEFDEKAAKKWVRDKCKDSRAQIGALLLDQSVWTGVGNIFRAEALFRTGIHPATPANQLSTKQFNALWKDMLHLMRFATDVGKIIGVDRKDIDKPPSKLRGDERFLVYKCATCRRCGAELKTAKVGGRPIQWCPKHQKPA